MKSKHLLHNFHRTVFDQGSLVIKGRVKVRQTTEKGIGGKQWAFNVGGC